MLYNILAILMVSMAAIQKSRGISNAQAEGCSALWSHPVFSSFTCYALFLRRERRERNRSQHQ